MLSLLEKRRSIRTYQKKPLTQEQINQLVKAALLSPTSKNSQCWEFIVVQDQSVLASLAQAKSVGSAFVKDAALAIVVLGDEEKSNVWIEDTAVACTIIQLTAESLGLGSCWVQIRERQHSEERTAESYVQELLSIPSQKRVTAVISLGYPQGETKPQEKTLKYDQVYLNQYGAPFQK